MVFSQFNHENRRVANFHYHFRKNIRSVKEIVGLSLSEVYPVFQNNRLKASFN